MKLKYFLRGLGMGIVFSAVFLMFMGGAKKEALTDEEIIMRASLLGMVKAEDALTASTAPVATQTPEVSEPPEPSETPEATETPASTETPEASESPSPSPEPEEPKYVTLTIEGGMASPAVARALEAAGLVSSAVEFDRYLCDNGYASLISIGTCKIRIGADFEEIAKEITN